VRRVLAAVVLAVALAGAQSALLLRLGGGRVSLALPLALVVWQGLEAPLLEGTLASLAVGFAVDVFAGGSQGLLTSLAVVLYLTSRLARNALSFHGRLGFGALVALQVFCYGATAFLLVRATAAAEAAPSAWLLWRGLGEALATGVVAALAQPLLARLERHLAREPEPGVLGG
jgi:hypothetical protein